MLRRVISTKASDRVAMVVGPSQPMAISEGGHLLVSSSSTASIGGVSSRSITEQRRYRSTAAQIRHLTKVLQHKNDAQSEIYKACLDSAAQLQPKTFVEVGSASSDDLTSLASMPLSGAVVAVSDVLDVEGFSTRYDVKTRMLHKVPKRDQPFVKWLRMQGARVAGKLVGSSPLGFEESADLQVHSAAIAIKKKACHYAILNSFIGTAGLTASAKYDVVTFKPSCDALDDSAIRFPSSCGTMSIMASRIDDIMYLWEVYTGTFKKIEALAEKFSNEAALASMAAAAAQQRGGSASAYEHAAQLVAEAVKAPPTLMGLIKRQLLVSTSFFGFFKSRDQHVHAFTSSWQQRREGVLKVGIPIQLIDDHYSDKMSALEFEAKIKGMYEALRIARKTGRQTEEEAEEKSILNSSGEDVTSSSSGGGSGDSSARSSSTSSASSSGGGNTARRGWLTTLWRLWSGSNYDPAAALQETSSSTKRDYRIDFIPVHLNLDMDRFMKSLQRVADYEMAQLFIRENAKRQHGKNTGGVIRDAATLPTSAVPPPATPVADGSVVPPVGAVGADGKPITAAPTTAAAGVGTLPSPSTASTAAVFGTGLFEELPQSMVSTLFNARSISDEKYQRTVQVTQERISSTIDEVFVDVDILCLPVLSEPFIHGNIRSCSFSLPFVTNGNPLISLSLNKDLSVMLVGELGRSTQLLEDAISFADHVKGEAPGKWWRRALFGKSDSSR